MVLAALGAAGPSASAGGRAGLTAGLPAGPTYRANDFAGGQAMSILPPGENGLVNPVQAAQFQLSGARPAGNNDQLATYARLIYAPANLADAALPSYFNDESFGVPAGQVTRVERPSSTLGVTIYRDTHDVPHIYGDSLTSAAFGAGYSQAEDRLFFMDVLRHYGQGTLSSFLGPSCADERMDHDQLASAPYTAAQAQAQLDALPTEYGSMGQRTVDFLTSYSAGVNAYINATRTDPTLLPADYAAPAAPPMAWQPTDSMYVGAVIGGILGKGGGHEVGNAALLQYLQSRLGQAGGRAAFGTFKEQNDPDAPTTVTDKAFPYEIPGRIDPATTAMPDNAAAPLVGGPTDTTPNCDLSSPSAAGLAAQRGLLALPRHFSNALLVDARHSASGHPIAVFGPQVGYFAPEIFSEEDIHAPGYQAEGVSLPGTGLVEIGRGVDYAWSATSAGSDIVDQRLEQVCDPAGGAPASTGTSYLYRGRCLPMQKETFSEVGIPKAGGQGAPVSLTHTIYLTVHGVVQGWTTARHGQPVAVVDQRTTFNHDIDSAVGFMRWADPALNTDARSWMKGAAQIGYTFNWLYADNRDIAVFTSGRDPVRPGNVDPNLPTWGTGNAEWRGLLPAAQHPQEINPSGGLMVSWNNKPARGFSASDATFSYGPLYRSSTLVEALHAQLAAHHGRLTRANVVSAMQVGASADFDGRQLVPALRTYLAGRSLPAGDAAMLRELGSWVRAGGLRRKAHPGDTQYGHAAAVAIMDELEPRLIRAMFDPIFAAGGVGSYAGADNAYRVFPIEWVNAPNNDGSRLGSAYDDPGWPGHELRLLRELSHLPVGQPFAPAVMRRLCGPAGVADCPAAILGALTATYRAMVAANGGSTDVTGWTQDTATHHAGQSMPAYDAIAFSSVGVVGQPNIDWQNRPTFQQVVTFPTGRRPGRADALGGPPAAPPGKASPGAAPALPATGLGPAVPMTALVVTGVALIVGRSGRRRRRETP